MGDFLFNKTEQRTIKKERVVKIFKPIKYTVEEERGFLVIALVLKRITGGNSNCNDYDNLMRCFFFSLVIHTCATSNSLPCKIFHNKNIVMTYYMDCSS